MLLQGRRCRVRPWRIADAESLARAANNISVARQLRDRFPHPYHQSDAVAFLRFATAEVQPGNLAIEVDGEAAGGIGYVRGSDIERYSAEIGYWLGEVYWGRGIVTEALVMVTESLFRDENLLRIFALPFADNEGSIRVLEKAGYEREAVLRASAVKFGVVRDQALYVRINPSWRAPKGS